MSTLPKISVRPPSPNNVKIAIALAYKGIEHEVQDVAAWGDGAAEKLIELSGQPLTPVIEHKGVVLFDSCAILRFLDANFDGPRLYSADRAEMKEIESWEMFHLASIGRSIRPAFGVVFGREPETEHASILAKVNQDAREASAAVETRLAEQAVKGSAWLVGNSMTAADICVASMLIFAAFPEALRSYSPLWKWFGERVDIGTDRTLCREWIGRVFTYLPVPEGV